jgi:hypothetical protein
LRREIDVPTLSFVRLGVIFLASAAAATAVSGAGAVPGVKTRNVPFATLWHVSGEGTAKDLNSDSGRSTTATYVLPRLGETQYMAPSIISTAHLAELDRFPWSKRFVVLTAIVRPSTGYAVTIRRVKFQRAGLLEQICVFVAVKKPAPGQPVERRAIESIHAVHVARRGFGLAPTRASVTLDLTGKVLSRTSDGPPIRPKLCGRP